MKRVAFVSLADISSSNGQGIYARKVLPQIINELDSDKFDSYLISPKPQNKKMIATPLIDESNARWLPEKKNRNILWHVYAQILIFIYLLRIKPSIVVFSIKPSFFAIELARKIIGFEKIILVEGLGKNNLKTLGGKLIVLWGGVGYRLLFKNPKAIFVAYQSALNWDNDFGVDCHKEVIPCGVDTNIFNSNLVPQYEKVSECSEVIIGYVGSFRNVHRLDLLASMLLLNDRINLRLIGNGECFSSIKEFVLSNNLSDRVEFVGEVAQTAIPKLIQPCHILWAFTDVHHWGVPIKAFEYLACNKFVIASRRKEFDFIEKYEFGLILETNDVSEIESSLKHIIDKAITDDCFKIDSYSYINKHNNWTNFRKVADYVY